MQREQLRLVVDVEQTAIVRREAGPIGWVVVEVIAAHARPGDRVIELACSSRSLAEVVGVSKDSAARALRRLMTLGVVERVDARDQGSGRFAATTYLLDLAACGIEVAVGSASHGASEQVPQPRSNAAVRVRREQLALSI